tara:strand:- start:560 stop:733 length:174 start_codon:yes stop_codon:yes gene_type:complete
LIGLSYEAEKDKISEVVDVCFGKAQMKEIALMEKLAKYRNEFLKLNVMIHRCDDAES